MSSLALIIDVFAKYVAESVYEGANSLLIIFPGLKKTSKNQDSLYIDCKYYTASVKLEKIDESESMSLTGSPEGIIICFDPNKSESLKSALKWLEVDTDENIPIRLLVCETLPDSPTVTDIFKSATSNHFEVIQLSPDPNELEEDEKYGISRIISAMTAHEWSNLVPNDSKMETRRAITHEASDVPCGVTEAQLSDVFDDDEDKFDDTAFNDLFPKLMEARSKAAGLDFENRRKMAEKLTVRLWRAMKLDEDEINGLSDDGDG